MKILAVSCGVEKEPLKSAFGFKGSALTCLWQVAVKLQSEQDYAVGLGVQSVLWSDAGVFLTYGEADSNAMMYRTTRYALSLLQGMEIQDPFEALDRLFLPVYSYAVKITNRPNLSKTFVLNALVPVDLALWQLWCREYDKNFDAIWPATTQKQQVLANVPLITYGTSLKEVRYFAEQGTPLLKIKIGSDPNKNGSIRDMLNWDQKRLLEIHKTVRGIRTPYTEDGFNEVMKAAVSDDLEFVVSNTTEAGIVYDPACALADRPCSSFPGKLTQVLYTRVP